MRNVGFVVVALGMVACNSPRPVVVDSGITPGTDSGPGRDAFVMPGTDAGSPAGTCGSVAGSTAAWPALPASCLPRCTTATATAYNQCVMTYQASPMAAADQMTLRNCETAAFAADHTATVQVATGATTMTPVSCGGDTTTTFGCLEWQALAAEAQSCGNELTAYITCVRGLPMGTSGMTGCPNEYQARATCRTTNMSAIQTAVNTLGSMCFG